MKASYSQPLVGHEQLVELTGYERPASQRRWLERHGIKYAIRRDGTISTTWGLVEAALTESERATEPNFGVLDG